MPGLSSRPVFSLREDSDRVLWVGTRSDGLYTVDLNDYEGYRLDKLKCNAIEVLDKYDISHHTILSIFEDKDKNIWLGTSGDGIFMIGNEERKFTTIQTKFFLRSAERYLSYYGCVTTPTETSGRVPMGKGSLNSIQRARSSGNTTPKTKQVVWPPMFLSAPIAITMITFGSGVTPMVYIPTISNAARLFIIHTRLQTPLYHWEIRSALFMKTPRATSGSGYTRRCMPGG